MCELNAKSCAKIANVNAPLHVHYNYSQLLQFNIIGKNWKLFTEYN